MTQTTGTTNFSPSLGDFIIDAYAQCGVRRTELLAQHMQDARFATNRIMSKLSASGVNLWAVDLQTVPLIAGQATYSVPADTIFILDVYLSIVNSNSSVTDRLISPLSRSDYAAIANKDTQSTPTTYWMDRLLSPTITLWAVPDKSNYWTLKYYRATQIQDTALGGGLGPELPYKFFDWFGWELAWRLATIYAPDKAIPLKAVADEAWRTAVASDTEDVGVRILPTFQGYFR